MSTSVSGMDNTPFFILGCVRSGTTMLRDLLRLHPRLECPEETHFYRWADPYGSPRYDKNYITGKLFREHRKLDGIDGKLFHEARFQAQNRADISKAYGELYLRSVNNPSGRWFDKTPQNVYGIFLLAHQFPDSKFVHIHRHPVNVASSLVEGKVMAKHSIKGAVNYWNESMILIDEFKKIYQDKIYELSYEQLTLSPGTILTSLCEYLGEDFGLIDQRKISTHREKNKYKKILTPEEIAYVQAQTSSYAVAYGYESLPDDGECE